MARNAHSWDMTHVLFALAHTGLLTHLAADLGSNPEPEDVLRVEFSIHDADEDEHGDAYAWSRSLDAADRQDLQRLCEHYASLRQPQLCNEVRKQQVARWEWDDAYFMLGVAPAATFGSLAMHPHLRYDAELGMTWAHTQRARSVSVGVDGHIFHLFDRSRPGGGADVVVSSSWGAFYVRGGLGVLGGLPYGPDPTATRPAVGGVVGMGLQVSDGDWGGRVGLDYDLRVDRGLALTHTVLLSARFMWGM